MKLVLHLGFAGTRKLCSDAWNSAQIAATEQHASTQLRALLAELPHKLRLSDPCFLVGVSQIATGADRQGKSADSAG